MRSKGGKGLGGGEIPGREGGYSSDWPLGWGVGGIYIYIYRERERKRDRWGGGNKNGGEREHARGHETKKGRRCLFVRSGVERGSFGVRGYCWGCFFLREGVGGLRNNDGMMMSRKRRGQEN